MTALEAVLARARAAVVARHAQLPAVQEPGIEGVVLDPTGSRGGIPNLRIATVRGQEPPAPLVHVRVLTDPPAPRTSLQPS